MNGWRVYIFSPTQQQTSNCWLCGVDCGGGDVSGGWWRSGGGQPGASQLSVPRMVQRSPSPPASCSSQQPGQTRGWCWATVLLLAAAPVTLASKLEFKHHNNTELAAILQQVTRRDSCCAALHHQHMDRDTITKQKCSTSTNNLHINCMTVNLTNFSYLCFIYFKLQQRTNIWTMCHRDLVNSHSYVSNIWYWHLDSETESKWKILEITEMT